MTGAPQKLNVAIIGPGNIGTDLLVKAMRSERINPVWMVGVEESAGIIRAREFGLNTSVNGVEGLLPHMHTDKVDIVFDATSAYVHEANSRAVTELGAIMIDLTRSEISGCMETEMGWQSTGRPGTQRFLLDRSRKSEALRAAYQEIMKWMREDVRVLREQSVIHEESSQKRP